MVKAGLLTRVQADDDRRNVILRLSLAGQALVGSVMRHRSKELEDIASRLSPVQRSQLQQGWNAFTAAADTVDTGTGDLIDQHLLRWMT